MLVIEKIEKLNSRKLPFLTVIAGEDLGQFDILKMTCLEKIGFDSSDLTYSYFDMRESLYNDVELDLLSIPLITAEKIVILDHFVDVTTSGRRFLTDSELKSFEIYVRGTSKTSKIIILAEGKLDNRKSLVKLLKHYGQIFQARTLKTSDIRNYFIKKAQMDGLDLSRQAFETLFVKSNGEFGALYKNLSFLKSYKVEYPIKLGDITAAIPKTLQDNVFDLTQFILKKQVHQARRLICDLILRGKSEIQLLSIMVGQFRTLTHVKILVNNGRSEQQITRELSGILGRPVNPYQVKFALQDVSKVDIRLLQKCLILLIETDYHVKMGTYEKGYLLDLVVLKMIESFFGRNI